uniref:hypothetical protein n=1 Tax=Flavobacterium sp. TaxID=239 RepID=UPI00404B2ECB
MGFLFKNESYKAALTGVAIADKITGPYEYIDSFRIHAGIYLLNIVDNTTKTVITKRIVKR